MEKNEEFKEAMKLAPIYKESILKLLNVYTFDDKTMEEKAALLHGLMDAVSDFLIKDILETAEGKKKIIAYGMEAYRTTFLVSMMQSLERNLGMPLEEYFK
jgi:hypothetical protein